MGMNLSCVGLLRGGNYTAQGKNGYGAWTDPSRNADADKGKSVGSIRRMLSRSRQAEQDGAGGDRVYQGVSDFNLRDDTFGYSDSLRAERAKAKDTALQLKKLRYDFKAISTQILRSKTSANAKQVAARARREVLRLKRQRQSGEYDDEELQSAITHAQAVERAARKKARHLEEEEMVKVAGGPCAGELEEKGGSEDEDTTAAREDVGGAVADDARRGADAGPESGRAQQRMMRAQAAGGQAGMPETMQDMISEMAEEMADSMRDMLEDMGLSELADSMLAVDVEMDPADLKMMKLKHRSEEMRAIAEADSEYLKALFERLERMKGVSSGGSVPVAGGGAAPVSGINLLSVPGMGGPPVSGALPMAVPGMGGGIDISV